MRAGCVAVQVRSTTAGVRTSSEGECDCDGNVVDALGVCGGTCEADEDGDGICDDGDSCVGLADECGFATSGRDLRLLAARSRLKGRATVTGTWRTSWCLRGFLHGRRGLRWHLRRRGATASERTMGAGCAMVRGPVLAAVATTFRKGSAIATATCWMRLGRAEVRANDLNGDGFATMEHSGVHVFCGVQLRPECEHQRRVV